MSRSLSLALLFIAAGCSQRSPWRVVPGPAPVADAAQRTRASSPVAATAIAPTPADESAADAAAIAHLGTLLFPVAGGHEAKLADSFDEPRDGGTRVHRAIDIMAPRGTPVLAVSDGRILRLSNTAKGGISVYAANLDEQYVYYYAHLDRYHPSVYAGRPLLRGDTIGYVGTTGNAPKDLPHLHFQLMRMPSDRKYWNGEPINPYPLLRAADSSAGNAGK